jgi:hypothetical protein
MAERVAERLARLEDFIGTPLTDGDLPLAVQIMRLNETIVEMDTSFKSFVTETNGRLTSLVEGLTVLTDAVQATSDGLRSKVRHLEEDVALLKRALISDAASTSQRTKVPEPKAFQGIRNAKELENFLWDMEQYFEAARISANDQVSITSMYLAGDAKLWWRTRVQEDASMGKPKIEEWETMKKELKVQFLPCNAGWQARESLKKLRHTGTPREYVKEFSSLMLDISNMSDEDKLFNFMSGLQPWAQAELRRQNVRDVQGAMAAADSLADYNYSPSSSNSNSLAVGKRAKEETSKSGKWSEGRKKDSGSRESSNLSQNRNQKPVSCFLCGDPHYMRDCPRKAKLNALCAEESSSEEEEPAVLLSPLQLLNAMRAEKVSPHKGLMYAKVHVNGTEVLAMLDTGATHNFVAEGVARKLGLKVERNSFKLKAVNSEAKPVQGTSDVRLKVGNWEGECSLMVMPLDEYDMILGIDFFLKAKAELVPYLEGMFIRDEESPCFVKALFAGRVVGSKQKNVPVQISKAGKKNREQSLVAAWRKKPEPLKGVSEELANVGGKFKAGMPKGELSKTIPPRQDLIHKVVSCEGESSSPSL